MNTYIDSVISILLWGYCAYGYYLITTNRLPVRRTYDRVSDIDIILSGKKKKPNMSEIQPRVEQMIQRRCLLPPTGYVII